MTAFKNGRYSLIYLEMLPLNMLLIAMLITLPSTVPSNPSPPCVPADQTQCGCPFASLITSNATRKLNWLSSQNSTQVDSGQMFDTIIASDAGAGGHVLWPGGIVFYVIDPAFSNSYQSLIRKAIADAQTTIGLNYVEFVEAKTSSGIICRKHYVHFQPFNDKACQANIGMQQNGITTLQLNENHCKYAYAIIHELLHAMGRDHEHARRDRDTYLQFNFGNILTPTCKDFQKPAIVDTTGSLAYDYESIMHYGSCAASCNGQYVFTKKDGSPIGINDKLTDLDVKKIRHMYPAEQKVTYIAQRLCRGPNDPVESVVHSPGENAEKNKTSRNSKRGVDDVDNNSAGYRTFICVPLMLVLVSMGMLVN